MMMGGAHKFAISPEEYIFAGLFITALMKYFDKFFSDCTLSGHHQYFPLYFENNGTEKIEKEKEC